MGADAYNEEWECSKITYGAQLAMECEVLEDPGSVRSILSMMGMPSCLASCCCCLLPIGGRSKKFPSKIRKQRAEHDSKYGPLRDFASYLAEFAAVVKSKGGFFEGAEYPGPVDISMYATVQPWAEHIPYVAMGITAAGLDTWVESVRQKMPADIPKFS